MLIGNDIVDLTAAANESNWQRKGYLDKIFTAAEQLLIRQSENPDHTVWLLWSMKEAAYKIHSRFTGIRSYAPLQLQCQPWPLTPNLYKGEVHIAADTFYTQTTLGSQWLHTIAACYSDQLSQINVDISLLENKRTVNLPSTVPQCRSHHGAFLASVYL